MTRWTKYFITCCVRWVEKRWRPWRRFRRNLDQYIPDIVITVLSSFIVMIIRKWVQGLSTVSFSPLQRIKSALQQSWARSTITSQYGHNYRTAVSKVCFVHFRSLQGWLTAVMVRQGQTHEVSYMSLKQWTRWCTVFPKTLDTQQPTYCVSLFPFLCIIYPMKCNA